MKSSPLAHAAALSLALACAAHAPASRAQESPGPASVPRQQESATAQARTIPAPRLVATLVGYTGPSLFGGRPALAAFSPDGLLLVTGGTDKTAYLYALGP